MKSAEQWDRDLFIHLLWEIPIFRVFLVTYKMSLLEAYLQPGLGKRRPIQEMVLMFGQPAADRNIP